MHPDITGTDKGAIDRASTKGGVMGVRDTRRLALSISVAVARDIGMICMVFMVVVTMGDGGSKVFWMVG